MGHGHEMANHSGMSPDTPRRFPTDTRDVTWLEKPPPWQQLEKMAKPVFVGPPSIRPIWIRALGQALIHPLSALRGLVKRRSIREVLSFMAWLDTARAFEVRRVLDSDGTPVPMASALRAGRSPLRQRISPSIRALVIAQAA